MPQDLSKKVSMIEEFVIEVYCRCTIFEYENFRMWLLLILEAANTFIRPSVLVMF